MWRMAQFIYRLIFPKKKIIGNEPQSELSILLQEKTNKQIDNIYGVW